MLVYEEPKLLDDSVINMSLKDYNVYGGQCPCYPSFSYATVSKAVSSGCRAQCSAVVTSSLA